MSLANKAFSIFQRDLILFVTNLITSIVVARMLGPVVLGIWTILSMVPSYAEALGRLKVDLASVHFIGQKTFRREDVLFNLNMITLVSIVVVVVVILWQFDVIYSWLFKNEIVDYKSELLALIILIPIQFLSLNYSYFHIAEENVLAYNRMVLIRALTISFLMIVFLVLTPFGLWSMILATLIGSFVALLYGMQSINYDGWISGSASGRVSFAMIRYGMHFYLAGILGQLQQYGTNLIAVAYLIPAQIAFLSQGQGVGRLLHKVVDPLNTILFPRISSAGNDEAINTSCIAFRISAILLLAGGMVLAIIAEPLVVLLYGIDFHPTAAVVRYLLPGLMIGGACSALQSYFTGTGRANLIPKIQVLPVGIQLLLTWLFQQWWGLNGVAVALSIGLALYGLSLFIAFVKVSDVSLSELVPRISDLRYLMEFVLSKLGFIGDKNKTGTD